MQKTERDATFTEFVASRQDRLRRYAYVLTGDWSSADDLLQSALTKLYVVWPRLQRNGGEEAYVRRMLVHGQIDTSRKVCQRESPGLEGQEPFARPPTDVAARDELVQALQGLPVMQKRTVVLRYVFDLSVDECAAELGVSSGTIKSHTARALQRLQSRLTPQEAAGDPS